MSLFLMDARVEPGHHDSRGFCLVLRLLSCGFCGAIPITMTCARAGLNRNRVDYLNVMPRGG